MPVLLEFAPMKNIFTMVLAGGKGERLSPLTAHRAKPAVPFGGKYRIIDFTEAIRSGAIVFNSSEESSGAGGDSRQAPERRPAIKKLFIFHLLFDVRHLSFDLETPELSGAIQHTTS